MPDNNYATFDTYSSEDGDEYEDGTLLLYVSNTKGVVLPESGGPGTAPFRIAGLLLASCSAYLICRVLKRREEWMEF